MSEENQVDEAPEADDLTLDFDTFFSLMLQADRTRREAGYSQMQKHIDYRRLFLGSELGQRVLASILADGHFFKSSVQRSRPIDPYATHLAEGERNRVLDIVQTMIAEPQPKPTKQRERTK